MGVYKMLVLNCQKMLEINCHFLLESTCRLQDIANRVYEYYQRQSGSDDSYEKSILANIKDVDLKLNNILKAIEMGIINETTQSRMQELEERKRLFNDELIAERNRQKYA